MTNIAQLPTGLSGTLPVTTNSDLRLTLQFNGPGGQPIDLTGIAFRAQLRPSVKDNTLLLDLSTANGLLQVQGPQLTFAVPRTAPAGAPAWCTSVLPIDTAGVLDIVATGDGQTINLCQISGPIAVPISTGVSRDQTSPV